MIARVATVLVAVVVLGWLAVSLRDDRLAASAATLTQDADDTAALRSAASKLDRAGLLNPDASIDVSRSAILRATGDNAGAIRLLGDVVRREPDNLDGWRLLRFYARDDDEALEARALRAQRRLDPIGTRAR